MCERLAAWMIPLGSPLGRPAATRAGDRPASRFVPPERLASNAFPCVGAPSRAIAIVNRLGDRRRRALVAGPPGSGACILWPLGPRRSAPEQHLPDWHVA